MPKGEALAPIQATPAVSGLEPAPKGDLTVESDGKIDTGIKNPF